MLLVALHTAQAVFRAFSSVIRSTRTTYLGSLSGSGGNKPAGGVGGGFASPAVVAIDMREVEHLRLEPVAEDRLRRCAAALELLESIRGRVMALARKDAGGGGVGQQLSAAAKGYLLQYESWRATL